MNSLSKFISRNSLEQQLFGWVTGIQYNIPAVSADSAIKSFIKYHNISEEEWPFASMKAVFHRMKSEYLEHQKSH